MVVLADHDRAHPAQDDHVVAAGQQALDRALERRERLAQAGDPGVARVVVSTPLARGGRRPGAGRPPAAAARRSARDAGPRGRGAARRRRARHRRSRAPTGRSRCDRPTRLQTAAAKAFGGTTALEVATAIFDFSGASAADRRHGLDRRWRNARTHTLHDPRARSHHHLGATRSTPPPAARGSAALSPTTAP